MGEVSANADGEGKEKVSLKQATSQASAPPALPRGEPFFSAARFSAADICFASLNVKFAAQTLSHRPTSKLHQSGRGGACSSRFVILNRLFTAVASHRPTSKLHQSGRGGVYLLPMSRPNYIGTYGYAHTNDHPQICRDRRPRRSEPHNEILFG